MLPKSIGLHAVYVVSVISLWQESVLVAAFIMPESSLVVENSAFIIYSKKSVVTLK